LAVNQRILVTNLPATRYYGTNHVWYINKNANPDIAASALKKLLLATVSEKKEVASHQYTESNFSWAKISQQYLKTYDSLLKTHKSKNG
jgi:glycosyltransferase involved in cell wall biosynthesis